MQKKIKLIIFDLDGTLVDAYQAIYKSFDHTMQKLDLPRVDHKEVREAVGWGERKLFEPFVKEEKIEEARAIYRKHHLETLLDNVEYLPGALELLGDIKNKGCRVAIATNRPLKTSKMIIDQLKMDEYLDSLVSAEELQKFKPDPAILLEILKQYGLGTNEAVYVGDMAIDVQTGQQANIQTIAVTTGSSSREEIEEMKPFKIIDEISVVSQIIDQLNDTSVSI